MAINPEAQYPGKIAPSTPGYPYGAARNIIVPGDGTGTPWEAALVNDLFGFQQALLTASGTVPTGTPENASASQYLTASKKLFGFIFLTFASLQTAASTGKLSGLTKVTTLQHTSSGVGGADYAKDGTAGTPNTGDEWKFFDSEGSGWQNQSLFLRAEQFGLLKSNSAAANSTVLQAIADRLETEQLPAMLPVGQYNFVGPITFTSPSFDWTFFMGGPGFKLCELVNTAAGGKNGFELVGTNDTESVWSKFKGFLITGNSSSGDGFYVELAGRVEFDEMESSDNGGHGYNYQNSWAPSFYRCRGDRNTLSGANLQGGSDNKINGARFEGGAFSSNGLDGIYLEASATDDDVDSGAIVNVGLSNNNRYGIWNISPSVTIQECFPEFNKQGQIKIGDAANAKTQVGALLINNFISGLNSGGPNYRSVIIEEARGVEIKCNNFNQTTDAIEIDAASTLIDIGPNRYSGSVTNVVDVNGTVFNDKLRTYRIGFDATQVHSSLIETFDVLGGAGGVREDIVNTSGSNSNPVKRWQLDGVTKFGFREDGRLITGGAIATAGSPTTIQNKIEIFDGAGVSLGWIPIYQNF